MALIYLLDSVILIDHLNQVSHSTAFLAQVHKEAVVSVITRAEVLAGFDAAPVHVQQLLDQFPCLDIEKSVADLAARFRRRHRWKLPDAFQAALAEKHGLRFATRNVRDFPPERFPFVLQPYEI